MSAWTVYWVLQLDSIRFVFILLAILSVLAAFLTTIFGGMMSTGYGDEEKGNGAKLLGYAKRLWVAFAALLIAANLTPSSKTAAAMIVLPALTSEEVVGTVKSEAKELYEMAKEALKDKITTEEKKVEGQD